MSSKPTYAELQQQLVNLQQKFEDQLSKQENRYKTLFNTTGTATCIFGDDRIITLINKEFEKLSGYSKYEVEGKMKWSDFVDKEDLKRMEQYHNLRTQKTGHPPEEYEFIFVDRKGKRKTIYLKLDIFKETNERVASLTNITNVKKGKDELEESHRMLETLIANLPGMVYRCRNLQDWSMEYMSEGCRRITGYDPENFLQSKIIGFGDIINPEDREYVWDQVQDSIQKNNHFEVEYRINTAQNEVRWVWERGKIVGVGPDGTEILEGFVMDITDSKTAQQALKESEETYRVLAETARDIICIHDMEGKITYLNSAGLEFLGEKTKDVIGSNIMNFLPKEYRNSAEKRKRMRMRGYRQRFIYETVFNKTDGKEIPVEVSSSIIQKDGANSGVLLVARDITERKKAERKLKESEEWYRGLFETTGTATIVYDKDKIIRVCNRKFEELYGKKREEIIDRLKWTDFVHPDDLPQMEEYHRLRELGLGSPPTEYEFKFLKANGEERVVYHTVKFFKDTQKRIASFADITALKEAEKALKFNEERLKLAIDGGELGLWDWNITTGDLYFNNTWAKMIGYSPEELEPSVDTWKKLVHPEDWDWVEKNLVENIDGRRKVYNTEHRLKCKDGSYKWILDTGKIVAYDEDGQPERMVGIHKDITERKEAEIKLKNWNRELEQEVKKRTYQLEETNKELESFSYSVSHDLKAPLRAIEGFSNVLREEYQENLDDEAMRYLSIIHSNTSKMNQLITDLLRFSRLGRKALKMSEIDTKNLVYKVYSEQKDLIKKKDHEFIVTQLPVLYADPTMMKIVFSNLISNAFKFSVNKDKPRVKVGSFEKEGKQIIYVKDNGEGFNMKYATKLFDTFQRLHNESQYKGSGIGLSLVQRVVNKHGGKIWAESKEGEGATFYFFLSEIDNTKKNK